jgi:tRNA nucleotidyltransferase (CCA-adding enzyme)
MGQDPCEVDDFEKRVRAEIEKKAPFGVRDLAINGDDIKAEFGIPEGPLIGRALNELMEMVLDDPSKNTRPELLSKAKEYLSQNRS